MAASNLNETITNIYAKIAHVDENYLLLKSDAIGDYDYIKVSPVLAYNAFPRPTSPISTSRLSMDFNCDDLLIMDIRRDESHYIPLKIHAMELYRIDGVHIVGDGLLIGMTEFGGCVIRNAFAPDFICAPDVFVYETGVDLRIGAVVTFEMLITEVNGENTVSDCLRARVWPPDTRSAPFDVRVLAGIVVQNQDGSLGLDCFNADIRPQPLQLYEGAFYGNGVPAKMLLGHIVKSTVCPKQASVDSEFEVIYLEEYDGPVPLSGRQSPGMFDGARRVLGNDLSQTNLREVECSGNFNESTMKKLTDAFLFTMNHADPNRFLQLVAKNQKFASVMMNQLGILQRRELLSVQSHDMVFPNYQYTPSMEATANVGVSGIGTATGGLISNLPNVNAGDSVGSNRGHWSLEPVIGETEPTNMFYTPTPPNFTPDEVFGLDDEIRDHVDGNVAPANSSNALPTARNASVISARARSDLVTTGSMQIPEWKFT